MKTHLWLRFGLAFAAILVLGGVATSQIREAIRIIGVGAAVQQFGPEINRAFNSLTGHSNTDQQFTKVVPIISVGVTGSARNAIGAAQVMGARENVDRVRAVAAPESEIFGEIRLRALIPVSSTDITNPRNIQSVGGVGVSGIVDLNF